MPPCPILLSDRPAQASTVRPNTGFSEKDIRTLRSPITSRFTLALLLGCLAGTHAAAEPIVVNKPAMESPERNFAEADLQVQYDDAWSKFTETVDQASNALAKELRDQAENARADGNLQLHTFWNEVNTAWDQTHEFEWDATSLRRQWWIDRFGNDVRFPHSVTTVAEKTAGAHKTAITDLTSSYNTLVKELVKRSAQNPTLLSTARDVEQELAALLRANNFRNQTRRRVTQPKAERPVSIIGSWTNENYEFIDVYKADNGTMNQGSVLRLRKVDKAIDGKGVWRITDDEQVTVEMTVGPAHGWKDKGIRFPQGLIATNGFNPEGTLMGVGGISWQNGFDWQGKRCRNADATDAAKTAVAGEWTHPNSEKVWKISQQGNFAEEKKTGGEVLAHGKWQFKTDGSYECSLSNGWRIRFWVFRDAMAQLPFDEKGKLAGYGRSLERVKEIKDE